MKAGRLIATAGAAILVSASAPLVGAAVAAAAATPAVSVNIPFDVGAGCEGLVIMTEGSNSSGAYVDAYLNSDPCDVGVEGAICNSDYTDCSYGGDIHLIDKTSRTGSIPINSSNHHGIRWWTGSAWQYNWAD
jgi:hypothetical protein